MSKKHLLSKALFAIIAFLMISGFVNAEMRSSITQYGVTWTFNGQYECGQFVTGDWWVVGPVTINSVSPSPSSGRNGSCLNPQPNWQGYDDRGANSDPVKNLYRADDRISFPATLQPDQSLVSAVSKPEGAGGFKNYGTLQSQAVLTVVSSAQPSGTFRPAYSGTYKRYFNVSQINTSILPNLPVPSSAPNAANIVEYTDPPRIDHLGAWQIQFQCAEDNWNNGKEWGNDKHKCYGRQYSELVSDAAMLAMLAIPEKMEIVYNLIQYGIDNYGVIHEGGDYAGDGGHHNARKFPIVFAAVLLGDADMLQIGDYQGRYFGEDDQTYYNSAGKALWGRRVGDYCWWAQGCDGEGCGGSKDVADPAQILDGCPTYRKVQTSQNWPGQMLATLIIGGQSVWNHDAYFDYVDRWMDRDVPGSSGAYGDFVDEMWNLYRDNLPSGGGIIDVTGVTVVPTSITLDEGMSQQLTGTVEPANATNRTINWTSNNTSVATVNDGLVSAITPGSAVITATTADGGFTDECAVVVNSLGTNVAQNSSVTVSDYDVASNKPGGNLVDGDVSDDARWSASGFPQWAEIDLGADYTLTRLDLFPYQNRAYQYIIEGKADGGSYSTLVDRSSNTESADNLTNNVSATVRYLKITVSSISGSSSAWVSLSELKAFTDDAPQPVDNEFYCSPSGSMANNGTSPSTPWADLETVMSQKTFADGATIYLMDGNHGFPVITEYNAADVTITNYAGANPVLDRIKFDGASHWILKGVDINPANPFPETPSLSHPVAPKFNNSMIQITASANITIDNCYAYSIENSASWTADDWNYKAWNGVFINESSDDILVTNTYFKNVNFGYYVVGGSTNLIFRNSVIENFCGDGVRPDCNYTVIENNIVKNCYETNGNHDDLLQIYRGSSGATGIVIRGNQFINNTDPNQPFLGECQGIALFDGWYNDIIIENNLVATNDWHGISLYGANNCKVVNNTVVDVNNIGVGPPWIKVTAHKDGTPSSGNLVRNNITTVMSNDGGIGTVDNNIVISWSDYDTYFNDAANRDYTTKAGSPAIDSGSSTSAPSVDIIGVSRPQGAGFDIGAYEYVAGAGIAVTGVTLTPSILTLNEGQTSGLTETVAPSNATNKNVSWGSNNTSIATVDANGLVTGISDGQATITVTTVDGGFTANCVVTVETGSQQTTTLNPVADSYVRGGSYESNNYGTDQLLVVKASGSAEYNRETYFKFDLSGITQPVTSALFRVYLSDGAVSTHNLKLVSDDSWTETGITYTNKPSAGSTLASWDATNGGVYIEADITSTVTSEAGDMLSLHISSNNTEYGGYDSRETANKPELVIVTDASGGTVVVTGVSVSPTTLSLSRGETSDLTGTVSPSEATDKSVTWSSSDETVATVDTNGLVTAVDEGQAIITVTTVDGSFTATCDVDVTVPVTGITVAPASISLNIGGTTDLTETITPADATDQTVVWSSDDETVATVDVNGLVTAVGGGQATIMVTTNDGGLTGTCQVTAYSPVSGVSVSPASLTLDIGEAAELIETVLPADAIDKSVTWSSSNSAVVTVDSNGIVMAISHGTVTITVTTNDGGYTATSEVTVNIGNLALNKPITVSAYQDDEYDYKPGENLVDGDVSDEERWSAGGFPQWAEIDLGANYDLNRIDLYPFMDRAYQYIVEAKVDGGSYSTIVDRSSNTEGADILSDNVSFNAARYVKITVSGLSGSSSTWVSLAELKVYGTVAGTVMVTDVSVSPASVTLDIDETTTLSATVSPVNATDQTITWSSSNESVATVDANGVVTAISSGQATITVTTNDGGFTDNCVVTVNTPQPQTVTLNPVADAYVRGGDYGGSNFGTEAILSVKKAYGDNYIRESYVKFDLSAITGQISSAVLRLYISSYNGDATHTFKLVSDDSWTETGITYNNRPSGSNTIASYDVEGSGSYIEIDVLSTVTSEAGGLLSIQITGNEDVGNGYDSREATNKPELVVTTAGSSTIPVTGVTVSPTSLSLEEGETSDLTETVTPVDATDQTVTWSSNNTSVATVNSSGLVTAVTAGSATITVTTNDGSYTADCSVTVTAPPAPTRTESIIASEDDQEIRSGGGSQWVGYDIHRVGGAGGTYDAASVHPFQLPALTGNEIVLDASFTVNLYRVSNNPNGNVDAYGLPYRTTSGVSATGDYWQGAYGSDAGATPIQDDFATTSAPSGNVVTNSTGNSNLADYINAQYAAGAQAGDYIFIRLNPDVADVSSYKYWEFYSADSPDKPVLDLVIGDDPYSNGNVEENSLISSDMTHSINVWPNPVNEMELLTIRLDGYNANETIGMKIVDITGKMVYGISNLRMNENGSRTLELNTNLMRRGIYVLQISNGTGVQTSKIGIQ